MADKGWRREPAATGREPAEPSAPTSPSDAPLQWPSYRAGAGHDGIVDAPPPAPAAPARPGTRTALQITVACLVIALGGAGVILARQQPWAAPAPVTAPRPEAPAAPAGPQWTSENLPPVSGLVRVEITPSLEADGIVMTPDGLVATSYARIAGLGGDDVMVRRVELNVVVDGGLPMRAEILGFDASRDVAVLRVPGFTPSGVARLGNPVTEGDALTLLDDQGEGMPVLGLPVEVSGTGQQCWRTGAAMMSRPLGFQFSVEPATGEPGGAVVSGDGSVVGLYYGGDAAVRHCAVPIAEVAEVVEQVAAGEQSGTVRVGPPGGLGIQLAPAGPGARDERYPTVSSIQNVGDLADAAGVRPGDLLTRVDGVSLSSDDLTTMGPDGVIRSLEPGRTVMVEWRSDGVDRQAMVEVGIGAQPSG